MVGGPTAACAPHPAQSGRRRRARGSHRPGGHWVDVSWWGATCRVGETTIGVPRHRPVTARYPPMTRRPASSTRGIGLPPHPVQGAQGADQAAGVHDLRRAHQRKDATRPTRLWRERVAVCRSRQRPVPTPAKRPRLRTHALGRMAGMRCLTAARHKAVHAHLASLTDRPARPRPGSCAWPELRRTLEQGYAAGARPADVAEAVYTRYATCPAHPPSPRTLQRWHHQRRWLHHPP